ncbi:Hypothetical protein SRAE_2000461200 [Strongyloides ratti]|uniref:Uncharacterized protein n=1 Tax=Strongyloides ratti TaxID=34506 RepID=A0A090LQU8_STRRB|nr:Hypothetical protein SRAE_2000461200 [Strongyloides ratti]CEF69966.1 Hypothetical protein SRAE_2000461200 [Strongyloides ratti]
MIKIIINLIVVIIINNLLSISDEYNIRENSLIDGNNIYQKDDNLLIIKRDKKSSKSKKKSTTKKKPKTTTTEPITYDYYDDDSDEEDYAYYSSIDHYEKYNKKAGIMHKCHIEAVKERIRIEKEEKEGSKNKTTTNKPKESSSSEEIIDSFDSSLTSIENDYLDDILKNNKYKFGYKLTILNLRFNFHLFKVRYEYNVTHGLPLSTFIDTL